MKGTKGSDETMPTKDQFYVRISRNECNINTNHSVLRPSKLRIRQTINDTLVSKIMPIRQTINESLVSKTDA